MMINNSIRKQILSGKSEDYQDYQDTDLPFRWMVRRYFLLIVSVAAATAAVHSVAVVSPPPC